ncbi:MAG: FtsX-like permease family protein [Eubacteriales bacterium]
MRICTLFMMLIIVLALFIIVIVTILGFSERRYDIGVLRCVGMSKPRIISLFTLETLLFLLAVMLAGLLFGSLLSGFFTDGLSAGQYKADNLAVLAQTGIRVLLAGLALSLLSSFMSAMFILRYQPMKILRNRN